MKTTFWLVLALFLSLTAIPPDAVSATNVPVGNTPTVNVPAGNGGGELPSSTGGVEPADAEVLSRLKALAGSDALLPADQMIEFLKAVEAAGQAEGGVMAYLTGLKGRNQAEWAQYKRAENRIMASVREILCKTVMGLNMSRFKAFRVFAIGFSGKWPKKEQTEMGFEGDFDVSFFSVLFDQMDPSELDSLKDVETELRSRLGVDPKSAGIVLTGMGHEKKAGVYVTGAGIKWAIDNMPFLFMPDAKGEWTNVAKDKARFYNMILLEMARVFIPESYLKGRKVEQLTVAEVRQFLLASDDVPAKYRALIRNDSTVKMGEAVAAGFDFMAHLSEINEAGTPARKTMKLAKQLGRYNSIFVNAMQTSRETNWRKRGGFTPEELNLIEFCGKLEQAETDATKQMADACENGVYDLDTLEEAATRKQNFNDLMAEMLRKKTPEQLMGEIAAVMLKMVRLSYNAGAFWTISSESGLRELKDLVENLDAAIKALTEKGMAESKEAEALKAQVNTLIAKIEGAEAKGIPFRKVFAALWKQYQDCKEKMGKSWSEVNPDLSSLMPERAEVRKYLESSRIGPTVKDLIPEWFWKGTIPGEGATDVTAPTKLVMELLDPASKTRKVTTTATSVLMYLDLAVKMGDTLSRPDMSDTDKVREIGKTAAILIIPHAWILPAMYQASSSGSYLRMGEEGVIVVTCLLCPELMVPGLLMSLYGQADAYQTRGLFQKELDSLFLASEFDPEPGHEKWDFKNADEVRYTWVALTNGGVRYVKEDLPKYIRGLADSPSPDGAGKAFKRMLENGDHLFFRQNPELAIAMANMKKFTYTFMWPFMELPDEAGVGSLDRKPYTLDLVDNTIPDRVRETIREKEGIGYVRYVEDLLKERAALQQAVVNALAYSIITSFEDEMRARSLVENGRLDAIRKEVEEIGKELGIQEELVAAVNTDIRKYAPQGLSGSALYFIGVDLNKREQQEAAKVINKWMDAYRSIAAVRRNLRVTLGVVGVSLDDTGKLLFGTPPFSVRSDYDLPRTDHARYYLMDGTQHDAERVLKQLKGERMDENDRTDMENFRAIVQLLVKARIYELKVNYPFTLGIHWTGNPNQVIEKKDVFVDMVSQGLKTRVDYCLQPRYLSDFWPYAKKPDLSQVVPGYAQCARDYSDKLKDIRENYQSIECKLKINGKTEGERNLPIPLSAELVFAKPALTTMVQQVKFDWKPLGIYDGSGKTYEFKSVAGGDFAIDVEAWRQGPTSRISLATATHVIKIPRQDEETDTASVKKPDDAKTNQAPKQALYSGVSPDIWEVVCNDREHGLSMRRRQALMKHADNWSSSVGASLTADYPAKATHKPAEIVPMLEKMVKEHCIGRVSPNMAAGLEMIWGGGVNGFSMAGFTGSMLNYGMWRCRGRVDGLTMGLLGSYHGVSGDGYMLKTKEGLEIYCMYDASGGGRSDNTDIGFLYSQTRSAQNEAKAILAGLTIDVSGLIRTEPYKGPKLDGSDAPKVKLIPSFVGLLKVHDIVSVKAVVENAQPEDQPFKYVWTGDHAGEGQTVQVVATKPGKFSIAVSVNGAVYPMGSASYEFTVEDFTATVKRDPPSDDPVVVGQEIGLAATLLTAGQPAGDEYRVQWQPHPEAVFNPFYGKDRTTKVVFQRPGRTPVWVEVLRKQGEVEMTHAVSEAIEFDVQEPELTLSLEPAQPSVGQEAKLKVESRPKGGDPQAQPLAGFDYLWDLPVNVRLVSENENRSEIVVVWTDPLPSWVRVSSQTPYNGDALGNAETNVTAQGYPLKVVVVGPVFGARSMVWDPVQKGYREAKRDSYLADELVACRAEIEGHQKPDDLRWQWTANEGTTIASSGIGKESNFSRHEVGTARVAVEVRTKDGLYLGVASNAFEVTVPADQVEVKQPLVTTLACRKTAVSAGEETGIDALASGGKAPYVYAWTGPGVGSGMSFKFKAAKPGKYDVRVRVTDAKSKSASTNIGITVTAAPPGQPDKTVPGGKGGVSSSAAPSPQGTPPKGQGVGTAAGPAASGAAGGGKPRPPIPSAGNTGDEGIVKPVKGATEPTGAGVSAGAPDVATPATPGAAGGQPQLDVRTAVVKPGERVIIKIAHPPTEKGAWIGFYKSDAGDKDYIKYSYLNALDNNTYEDVLAPDEAGQYNFRLFKDESYQPVAVSGPIEVR